MGKSSVADVIENGAELAKLLRGLESRDIAARVGVTPGQVAAVKAHVNMGTYGDAGIAADTEVEVADAVDTAFGLERDLQMALRQNIEHLE
jgi:hypothetical protein